MPTVGPVLRHLYLLLDGLLRNKTGRIASRGTAMTATPASLDPSSIVCHNCRSAGHYMSGCRCDGPGNTNWKSNKIIGQKKKSGLRDSAGRKWCTVHRTATHNESECYAQGAARSQTSSTHTAAVLGPKSIPLTLKIILSLIARLTSTRASHFDC